MDRVADLRLTQDCMAQALASVHDSVAELEKAVRELRDYVELVKNEYKGKNNKIVCEN